MGIVPTLRRNAGTDRDSSLTAPTAPVESAGGRLTRSEQTRNINLAAACCQIGRTIDLTMSAAPEFSEPPAADLETAADHATTACGGDTREAVKALLVANDFLEHQVLVRRCQAATCAGAAWSNAITRSERDGR